jgi:hypothetical protein
MDTLTIAQDTGYESGHNLIRGTVREVGPRAVLLWELGSWLWVSQAADVKMPSVNDFVALWVDTRGYIRSCGVVSFGSTGAADLPFGDA